MVNHTSNFIEPPKHLPPFWVPAGRFHTECLDKQWNGPILGLQPIRYHTQHVERSWRELKRILTRCNSKDVAASFVGEWMYRANILERSGNIEAQFKTFMADIARAYPGIGY